MSALLCLLVTYLLWRFLDRYNHSEGLTEAYARANREILDLEDYEFWLQHVEHSVSARVECLRLEMQYPHLRGRRG